MGCDVLCSDAKVTQIKNDIFAYSKATVITISFFNHFPITFQSLFYSLFINMFKKFISIYNSYF